ncbi:dTDP-4-dehydrorhamnose 3,5-epimerase [Limibaculum sp. FT325]|uniref:dTDP-4-dehydrorhamnose 3,5-epimerase n=1 Tax=Thermohalobaculum sediminis TaxID=2939436 RepID=UPI0020BF1ADB|nr:dTDP-4-dehydrorhamnose 3,5-epimerase [Limibaculum sediminis]MCL5778968.1 dTDP-4-dehydrorhamnose 3,5-epimerase [Limibaculum sediminis]
MFEALPLGGLVLIHPIRLEDERGFFSEVWSRRLFREAGIDFDWCQDNHSLSREAGTLRGLHYQAPPVGQAKLVRCTRGRIWDVAVDVRRGSPTEGQWYGVELSAENWAQLLVPQGFLHGFLTLEPDCEVVYKVDRPYDAVADGAIAWNDPELAITWPLDGAPRLSEKDRKAPTLADWSSPFKWET